MGSWEEQLRQFMLEEEDDDDELFFVLIPALLSGIQEESDSEEGKEKFHFLCSYTPFPW
jgi:hypothetical protein